MQTSSVRIDTGPSTLSESYSGIPHIIHFVHEEELDERIALYMKSWIDQHPTWKFKYWAMEDGRELIAQRYVANSNRYSNYARITLHCIVTLRSWECLINIRNPLSRLISFDTA